VSCKTTVEPVFSVIYPVKDIKVPVFCHKSLIQPNQTSKSGVTGKTEATEVSFKTTLGIFIYKNNIIINGLILITI
jgi:hypothetical protein